MKFPIILAATCALLALPGCEKTPVSPSAAVGPFEVNGETGTATGQAFGIEIKVAGASRAEVTSDLSGSPEFTSRAVITLADDVRIQLQTNAEGDSVTFELNGKSLGTLQRGDKVEIDGTGEVVVNGEKRTSGDLAPQ